MKRNCVKLLRTYINQVLSAQGNVIKFCIITFLCLPKHDLKPLEVNMTKFITYISNGISRGFRNLLDKLNFFTMVYSTRGNGSPKSVRSVSPAHSTTVIANEYAEQTNNENEKSKYESMYASKENLNDAEQEKSEAQNLISSSYKSKQNIKSVLLLSAKQSTINVNDQYCRTRRYDTAGKYRIGPTFITKAKLGYLDEHKPGKLSVLPDESHGSNLEFGLLTYLWTFTDQHDKQEIDLGFLKSLVDSGVNINSRDEHGQTMLHAIVRDWHPDVALFAIRNNADVNAQDHYGRAPLHLAAALNSSELVRLLLMNGADVNMETFKEFQTPMHYAAKYNSLDALKILIKYQGSIIKRDYKDRTVLYLAAEKGSAETAQFLLDIGAPAGVYDNNGNSALTCLLEKIPSVAYRALEQFRTSKISLKQSHMYLSHLETDTSVKNPKAEKFAKTPLEIITAYDDVDLIMHPVIQKSIAIKWKLFGKIDTIRKLLITSLYLICWLVLSYMYSDNGEYYYTVTEPREWKTHSWKIIFEALIIIFALYFFLKDLIMKREAIRQHQRWIEWKQHIVRSQYIYCHPAWPGERESLEAEIDRIRTVPSLAGKQKFWFAYECTILFLLAAIIILRIFTMVFDDNIKLFIASKAVFTINMIFSFMRTLKICIRFRYFSVFLKVTSLAVSSFIQIGFLYLQFFIPFVAVFWLMFGGDAGMELMRLANVTDTTDIGHMSGNKTLNSLASLQGIFYSIYESSFGQESVYTYVQVEKTSAQILISLYHIFSTFIALSIFVAFVTSKFTTNYKRCVAEASLLQASIVLQLEKGLSKRERANLAKYYAKFCSPLIVNLKSTSDDLRERDALSKLALTERHIASIENSIRDAEDRYQENDRKSHASIFESILGCSSLLGTKQENFSKTIKTELKDIAQKQSYMNKYLSKLL